MSSINQIKMQTAPPVQETQGPVADKGGKLLPPETPNKNSEVVPSEASLLKAKRLIVKEPHAQGTEQLAEDESDSSQSLTEKRNEAAQEKQEMDNAVAKLNDYVQTVQRDLQFSVDDETGIAVVKVIDRQSKEMIRQIPAQLALDLARKLNEQEPLHLFSARV